MQAHGRADQLGHTLTVLRPVPYHDPDAETLRLFVAATVGALLAGLVPRRPRPGPQPRSDEPPRVIELTVARS
ncbi:hypothetical protein GCM10018962_71330 [Dactylosporangium matsuzakiense]|uniref:Uncharacterized protein n=1 Tax=Dactylosporangium matsuzakiense TaxID=53360 RepID=A0A9W6NND0_9ACTN|nr:hypothetical protein GCM10017581_049190 [Dactylosporangium matsuzakiense]